MSESRIRNTKRILSSNFINHIISNLMSFINRTVIIYLLGSEYTGLSGLFSSILQVLSLAEFGFSMVIVYYLYEPLSKNDTDSINRILSWLKKIYLIVGSVILGTGAVCCLFLPWLIHGDYPNGINIYTLFLIYLVNSGISYFIYAYKEALLIADQKKNVLTNIRSFITIIVSVLQFVSLFFFRNYYTYAVLMIVGTIASNLLVNRAVKKRYPYIDDSVSGERIPNSARKELVGLIINRLSNVSRNAFDNIIISSTLGLECTSVYGNYYLIYNTIFGFTSMISSSMQASVGNSIAERSSKENYQNLLDFSFLYSWIIGWCAACLACLYQPFMELWVGKDLLLSDTDMFLFVVYFYVINMNHIRNQYVLGNAFWWKLKYVYLAEAIGNLILNIVLGKMIGVTGILIATILTVFVCNYLMCNSVLFKYYFKEESLGVFYRQQFYYLAATTVTVAVTYLIAVMFENLFVRAAICIVIPNILLAVLYRPCSRWKSGVRILGRVVGVPQSVKKAFRTARRLCLRTESALHPKAMPYYCPCCDTHLRAFTFCNFVTNTKIYYPERYKDTIKKVQCPVCGSLPRHRILTLWLSEHTSLLEGNTLYFAPEKGVSMWFKRKGYKVTTADLCNEADLKVDIEDTGMDSGEWDLVICNHVLEHVNDYRKALIELRRILKPGGVLICSFPIMENLETLIEEDGHDDEQKSKRIELYGQADHLRVFGADSKDLLMRVGFEVIVIEGGTMPESIMPVTGPADYDVNYLFVCKEKG